MDYNLDKYKKLIDEKENEVAIAKETLSTEQKNFKERTKVLENNLSTKRSELDKLNNITFPIKLIDLLTELSYLTNIDIKNMSVFIECDIIRWGRNRNIKEFLKSIDDARAKGKHINPKLVVTLAGSRNAPFYKNHPHPFYYVFDVPFNIDEIQLDGKTILQHCSVIKEYNDLQGEYYTKIVVDKKIENIILNIKLNDILRKNDILQNRSAFDTTLFYPCNIFTEAITNLTQRNYEPEEMGYQKKIKL